MSNATRQCVKRIEVRLTSEQERLLKRAAAFEGQSPNEFLLASAHAATTETIACHELLKLTRPDQRVFVNALLNPPAPNKALRAAAARYRIAHGC